MDEEIAEATKQDYSHMPEEAQFPKEQTEEGEFKRQADTFRNWVTADCRSGYPAAKDRYYLYVSLACPWAHRTIIVRQLKQLNDVVGMTVVDPIRDDRGWAFREGSGHSKSGSPVKTDKHKGYSKRFFIFSDFSDAVFR